MKQVLLAAALALAPLAAYAQTPAPAPKPDMALLPREVVMGLLQRLQSIGDLHPELITATVQQAAQAAMACLNDNPVGGRLVRQGPDQCPVVTEALAAQEKELADAKAAASKPEPAPAAAAPPTKPK
jgi:hypothetical protein